MAGLFHAVNRQHNPLGTAVQMTGTGRYTFGLALSAGLAGLLYGYDTVSISGAIEFLRVRYLLSSLMEGLVTSSIMIGAVIGAALAGFLSDRFGRRRLLIVGGLLFFVSAIWSALTFGPYDLIAARIVGGFGVGLTASIAVTYITESAPTDIRGTLAFSYQMLTVCGLFLTNVINYVIVAYGTPDWNLGFGWRWMLGLAAIPAAIFLLCMLFAPESPRYLIQHGHPEEGFRVLEQVLGTAKARVRTDDIIDSVRLEREMTNEMTDLFRPGLRKALAIGIFLAVFNQAVGINVISYYGPALFSRVGFTGDTEFLASASVSGVELVFTVIGMYLIDAAGRKRLMAIGSALMAMFALCTATAYGYGDALPTLVFIMLFAASFAFSMGPIPWIVIPELFPTFVRGRATGLCIMCLLAVNWAIAQFTPAMLNHFGGDVTFIVFAMLDLVCLVGIVTLVPETMGRTLEEIESIWRPKTELAAARYALSSADANIRHAEATLVRVANERVQAEAIKDAAERARIVAQKRIFAIQAAERAQAERLSATKLAEEARRAAHTITEPIVPVRDDALHGGGTLGGDALAGDALAGNAGQGADTVIGLSDFGIGPYADTAYTPYHRVVGFSMDGAQGDEDTMISEPIPLRGVCGGANGANGANGTNGAVAGAHGTTGAYGPAGAAETDGKEGAAGTTQSGAGADAAAGAAPSPAHAYWTVNGSRAKELSDIAAAEALAAGTGDMLRQTAASRTAGTTRIPMAAPVLYGEVVRPTAAQSDAMRAATAPAFGTAYTGSDSHVFNGHTFEYHDADLIDPLTGGAPLKAVSHAAFSHPGKPVAGDGAKATGVAGNAGSVGIAGAAGTTGVAGVADGDGVTGVTGVAGVAGGDGVVGAAEPNGITGAAEAADGTNATEGAAVPETAHVEAHTEALPSMTMHSSVEGTGESAALPTETGTAMVQASAPAETSTVTETVMSSETPLSTAAFAPATSAVSDAGSSPAAAVFPNPTAATTTALVSATAAPTATAESATATPTVAMQAEADVQTTVPATPSNPATPATPVMRTTGEHPVDLSALDMLMGGFESIAVKGDAAPGAPEIPSAPTATDALTIPRIPVNPAAPATPLTSNVPGMQETFPVVPGVQDWSAIDALAANAVESLNIDALPGELPLRENERRAFAMLSEDADAEAAHAWLDATKAEEEQAREDQALNNVLASLDSLIRRD